MGIAKTWLICYIFLSNRSECTIKFINWHDTLLITVIDLYNIYTCILNALHLYFRDLFLNQSKQKREGVIEIPMIVNSMGFGKVLDFIYTSQLCLSQSSVMQVGWSMISLIVFISYSHLLNTKFCMLYSWPILVF